MSARDVIAKALATSRHRSADEWADAILNALTSSGYRILGPDELDAVNRLGAARDRWNEKQDRQAFDELGSAIDDVTSTYHEFANSLNRITEVEIDEAIRESRALCATHQGDK